MLKVRSNIFETNSSSTHSICISRKNLDWKYSLPKELEFHHGEYGWDEHMFRDTQSKADYLYQAICDLYDEKGRNQILERLADTLFKYGVSVSFEPSRKDERGYEYGHIDHPYDLLEFIEYVCKREKTLLRYLFSEQSFVMTGNDNDDTDVDISVGYKHREFYKNN